MEVTRPKDPPAPTVVLVGPLKVGSCDVVSIDPSQTTGSLSRAWQDISVSVSSNTLTIYKTPVNLTLIELHLQRYPPVNTVDLYEIPREHFPVGFFTFTFSVTNFLGVKSSSAITIETSADDFVPLLSIMGPQIVRTSRWKELKLRFNFTVPACGFTVNPVSNLLVTWKMYKGFTYRGDLASISRDPNEFKLAPYTLDAGVSYSVILELVVSSPLYPSQRLETSVKVIPGISGVVANIFGGKNRTISARDELVMDGSGSYDLDYPLDGVDIRMVMYGNIAIIWFQCSRL